MCQRVLICLMMITLAIGPMAKNAFSQGHQSPNGRHEITSVPPKVLASAEEQLPKAKKSTGKYIALAVIGVALVALAAGGGGGGDKNTPTATDSGSVEVGW